MEIAENSEKIPNSKTIIANFARDRKIIAILKITFPKKYCDCLIKKKTFLIPSAAN